MMFRYFLGRGGNHKGLHWSWRSCLHVLRNWAQGLSNNKAGHGLNYKEMKAEEEEGSWKLGWNTVLALTWQLSSGKLYLKHQIRCIKIPKFQSDSLMMESSHNVSQWWGKWRWSEQWNRILINFYTNIPSKNEALYVLNKTCYRSLHLHVIYFEVIRYFKRKLVSK